MKKILIFILISLSIGAYSQSYNYKITSNKFRIGAFKIDTCYLSVVQINQMRIDTITKIDVNVYTDSLDMATKQNHILSITASWRGYSTLARQNDSIIAVLSRKFGINKNKFTAQ
jgi:hypothetical protein